MQDPVERLQQSKMFQKLDSKLNWAQVVLFSATALLVIVAVLKNVILA